VHLVGLGEALGGRNRRAPRWASPWSVAERLAPAGSWITF
jgi:hypothetical protein